MGEKMSLQQVRDWAANTPASNGWQAKERDEAVAALDAHLTQPAQAVDVGAIREVIRSMAQFATPGGLYDYWSRKLTAALPNANGKEGS